MVNKSHFNNHIEFDIYRVWHSYYMSLLAFLRQLQLNRRIYYHVLKLAVLSQPVVMP